MKKFEKGDVVELKSGSPKMSVTGYKWNSRSEQYEEDQIKCVWFVNEETKYGTFPKETLRKSDDN